MQADRDDRHASDLGRSRTGTQTLLMAIAVLILAGGAYLLMPGDDEESLETPVDTEMEQPRTVQAPQPKPEAAIEAAPDIPEPEPEEPQVDEPEPPQAEEVAVQPPTPEELDAQIRTAMQAADFSAPKPLDRAVAAPYILDRGVSSIDQLARGLVPRRTGNLPRPAGTFKVSREGTDYAIDPQGYRRYDPLVSAITSLPVETLANLFRDQRKLIEDAYAALGYPAESMDNTLIAALDNIIAAPVRRQPPELTSKGALWAYADPALEGASDLHKQLLRTGPENSQKLQRWARSLRDALLTP